MVEALLVFVVILVGLLLALQYRNAKQRTQSDDAQLKELRDQETALRDAVTSRQTHLEVYQKEVKGLHTDGAKREGAISTQLTELTRQHQELQTQTNSLVSALKHSGTRGTWGEIN